MASPSSLLRSPLSLLGLLCILLSWSTLPTEAVQSYRLVPYDEDFKFQRNCHSTLYPPSKPNSLLFCNQFKDLSCCPPAQDEQNMNYISAMFENGQACALRGDLNKYPFAYLYCMNCDPKQPRYVRNLPYFPLLSIQEFNNYYPLLTFPSSRLGKANLPNDCYAGTAMAYDPANFQRCYSTRRLQILVSKQWATKLFLIRPHIMSILDGCFIQKSAPCLDSAGAIVPNRERFMCGNDLVNPGIFFGLEAAPPLYDGTNPGMCAMNNFSVKGLYPDDDDCRMLYLERVLNNDDLSTPGLIETFGIRLVDDWLCSDDEYQTWVAKYQGNIATSFVDATSLNQFNTHLANGPMCRMTKAQVIDSASRFAWPPVNLTPEFVQDELCFSAAATPSVALVLALVGMLLALLL